MTQFSGVTSAHRFAMYRLDITSTNGLMLAPDTWYDFTFTWDLTEHSKGPCRLSINGVEQSIDLPLNWATENGISYVHFISTASSNDDKGLLIERVAAKKIK